MEKGVGKKREACVRIAQGDYITFVDDDDDINEQYIELILSAMQYDPDLILFHSLAKLNTDHTIVKFHPSYEMEQVKSNDITKRKPFHIHAWKREKVKDIEWPDKNYGEDWAFAEEALKRIDHNKVFEIDKILHYYNYSDDVTIASQEGIRDE